MHHTHTGVHRPEEDVRLPEPEPTGGCELSTLSSWSQPWRPEPSAGAASAALSPASPPPANVIPDSHHQAWTDYEIHWEHIHFYFSRNQGQRCSSFLLFLMSRTLEHTAYGACLKRMPQSADGAGSTEKLSSVKWHQIASENKTGLCQTRVSQVLWHARSWFGSAHHKLMDD